MVQYHLTLELKNMLLEYSNDQNNSFDGDLEKLRVLAYEIYNFNAQYRKKSKKPRRNSFNGQQGLSLPKFEPKNKIVSEDEYSDS